MLRKSEEGIAAIEFAILLPLLLAFIFGILQYSIYMFASMAVAAGTESGARIGTTGQGGCRIPREANIRAEIERFTSGIIKPGDVTVDIKNYVRFDQIGQKEACYTPLCGGGGSIPGTDYDDANGSLSWDFYGTPGPGGGGAVVVYTVTVPIPIFDALPPAYNFLPSNGTITARSAVRNEPFPPPGC